MHSTNLAHIAQRVEPLQSNSSLQLAAERLLATGLPALPVLGEGGFLGAVDQRTVTHSLASGMQPGTQILSLPLTQVPMIYATVGTAEALRVFAEKGVEAIFVVDGGMNMVGVLTPAHLVAPIQRAVRPPLIGGMATPFGVYLTTGAQSGGVSHWALVATGAILFIFLFLSDLAASGIVELLQKAAVSPAVLGTLGPGISTILFLAAMRFSPLAGFHAAEHMVVHAIERGEALEPNIVKNMPRVHPRCGTNLAVGAALFLTLFSASFLQDQETKLLVAGLVTIFFWRPLGSLVQLVFTTKPPSRKQLEAGIKSGKQLLETYSRAPIIAANPFVRLIQSGILQIMLGSIACGSVVYGLLYLFKVPGFEVL